VAGTVLESHGARESPGCSGLEPRILAGSGPLDTVDSPTSGPATGGNRSVPESNEAARRRVAHAHEWPWDILLLPQPRQACPECAGFPLPPSSQTAGCTREEARTLFIAGIRLLSASVPASAPKCSLSRSLSRLSSPLSLSHQLTLHLPLPCPRRLWPPVQLPPSPPPWLTPRRSGRAPSPARPFLTPREARRPRLPEPHGRGQRQEDQDRHPLG